MKTLADRNGRRMASPVNAAPPQAGRHDLAGEYLRRRAAAESQSSSSSRAITRR